jgi:hypothetical protein
MVEADDVLPSLASLALDSHHVSRVDPVTIVQRIGALVVAAHRSLYALCAVATYLAYKYAAALARVGLLTVTANSRQR